MYIFNKITVNPQLPKSIERLSEIAENLWWSWNTEFLRLFQDIDIDLWEKVEKNPVKFLKLVSQEKIEKMAEDPNFLKEYDKIVENFENYMSSKDTWFNKVKELSESLGYASNMKEYKANPDDYKGNVADISTVLRVSLTSKSQTPDLYEIMRILGKDEIMRRINNL